MWNRVIREYFAFPKKERKGILVLIIICLILLVIKIYSSGNYKFNEWSYAIHEYHTSSINEKRIQSEERTYKAVNIFVPKSKYLHEGNYNEFIKIGISNKTSAILTKFINRGAKLFQQQDLEKIYGVTESEKNIFIENYLFDPNIKSLNYSDDRKNSISEKSIKKVELNVADSVELVNLKGIGPTLAKRIILYRELLGGFIRKNQLLEVYGIDSNVFNNIENKFILDTSIINKIDINAIQADELKKFPYIGKKLSTVIVNYRVQHGPYRSIEDLKKIHLMNENIIRKIEPYLIFK